MVGRRHGAEEIAGKLAQADDLAAKGKKQQDISKALGVSIMTYHRWRKLRDAAEAPQESGESRRTAGAAEALHETVPSRSTDRSYSAERPHGSERLRDLETENLRLRRLVTDLLLEKVGLEEELRERQSSRFSRSRRG